MNRTLLLLAAPAAALLLPACIPVQVAVPQPVKIDVNMKVDVTSRAEGAPGGPVPGTTAAPGAAASTGTTTNAPAVKPISGLGIMPDASAGKDTAAGAAADLHAHLGEVQALKNDRLVGENNKGYLEVRQKPDGKLPSGESYADYAARIVQEVNDDRKVLYQARADKSGDPIDTHEQQAAQRRRDSAFAGEWLQDQSGAWKQK